MSAHIPSLFIVGSGRSGTTLVYETLARHPGASWVSNYSQRWSRLAAFHPQRPRNFKQDHSNRWAIRPVEGYRMFDSVRGSFGGDPDLRGSDGGILTAADCSPEEQGVFRKIRSRHVRPSHATFFLNKNTRNARRIGYLSSLDESARFCLVVRDPFACVLSLCRVAFFDKTQMWWREDITIGEAVRNGATPERLAAELWAAENRAALEGLRTLSAESGMIVKYEDFVGSPSQNCLHILNWAGVASSPEYAETLKTVAVVSDRNKASREYFGPTERHAIWDTVADVARDLGYEEPDD